MTSLPVASMVFNARASGISASIASTTPQRIPRSRLPRSDWLGSSTSPPLITRSNLSAGPIAALASVVTRPEIAAAAADPVSASNLRRDKADMALPKHDFLWMDDAPDAGLLQAAGQTRAGLTRPIVIVFGDNTGPQSP